MSNVIVADDNWLYPVQTVKHVVVIHVSVQHVYAYVLVGWEIVKSKFLKTT